MTIIKETLNVFIQNLKNEQFHLFTFHLLIVKSNDFFRKEIKFLLCVYVMDVQLM